MALVYLRTCNALLLLCLCLASELQKDAEANIGRIDKLLKVLKKLCTSGGVDESGLEKLGEGMRAIDNHEETINTWAIKFGFREEKIKKGSKRKA